MKTIITRHAAVTDLPLLAEMNKHLIEDEGSRNPMDLSELQLRMSDWLKNGMAVRIFEDAEAQTVMGYAVFCICTDDYDSQQKEVYLRQMFIKREFRSHGMGELALKHLMANEFPAGSKVVIDVLATNPRGEEFWKRMGFKCYYTNMQLMTQKEI